MSMVQAELQDLASAGEKRPEEPAPRWLKIAAWTVAAAYWAAGIVAAIAYRYQINPDGVSYLSVARQYAQGRFWDAVNGYWSPFYTWLLAPLLLIGVKPLLAAQILGVIIGFVVLVGAWLLAKNLGVRPTGRIAICATLVPLVLYLATSVISADLLSMTTLLLYLAQVTRSRCLDQRSSGLMTGLLAGVCYLAKPYLMWVCLGHLAIVTALRLLCGDYPARRVLTSAMLGSVVFAMIVAAWSAVLTSKYGTFMTNSTGSFNYALNGPKTRGYPMHMDGLIAPPTANGISAWDDPTYFDMSALKWGPWQSREYAAYQWQRIKKNWGQTLDYVLWYSPLSLVILALGALAAGGRWDVRPHRPLLVVLLALLLYPVGYLILHTEPRFLSPIPVLLLLVGMSLIEAAGRAGLGEIRRWTATAVVCASFVLSVTPCLLGGYQAGRDIRMTARKLARVVPAGSRVASDAQWHYTQFLSFHRDWRYHGEPAHAATADEFEADLKKHQIQYLMIWNHPQRFPFLSQWTEVSQGRAPGLKVFRAP